MKNTLYKPNHIRTYTGKYVNLLDPNPDTIDIFDIAHSLSNQCRFAGHINSFYSVAEHCIECSILGDNEHKLALLLHDAAEAYLLDIPRPLKALIPQYKELEDKFLSIIAAKFGFQYPFHETIIKIDDFMLEYEWMNYVNIKTSFNSQPHISPEDCEDRFLRAFHNYSRISESINNDSKSIVVNCTHIYQSNN